MNTFLRIRYIRFLKREFNTNPAVIGEVLRDEFSHIYDSLSRERLGTTIDPMLYVSMLRIQYMRWMMLNKDYVVLLLL